jgi:hypothetical protein
MCKTRKNRSRATGGRPKSDSITVHEYGDYGKRHHARKRHDIQVMLDAIPIRRPHFILVQRLDRFGTADPNQLG